MTVSYTMARAWALAAEIKRERPDLVVENHRDFSFSVDVFDPAAMKMAVVCQPERPELGQPGILRDLRFINEVFPKC
jgi:hypothetical protein